jgi:hypothetical protein
VSDAQDGLEARRNPSIEIHPAAARSRMGEIMNSLHPGDSTSRTIDSIIALAGCSAVHRILLAGDTEPWRIHDWRRRGFQHVATMATCRLPRGQYDVASIEWRRHSIRALETTLDWLVYFLSPSGMLVIWIDEASDTAPTRRKLRSAMERLGFQVEAGRRCAGGFAMSARRLNAGQRAMAAQAA